MYIGEAVQKAMEAGSRITRESDMETGLNYEIKPTNSYDACLLIVKDKKGKRASRRWNPTAECLMADDWIVVKV